MNPANYSEQIEEAVKHLPMGSMRNRARKVIKHLIKYAQPGNAPFWRLVNEWGFEHDYQPSDAGMHWSDNK